MHFVNQPLPSKKVLGSREHGVELMSLIANGKTLSQAASQLRTTSSTAIALAQEFLSLVLERRRWGWNREVRSVFEKNLHVIFTGHHELLAEAIVKYKIEMQCGSFLPWLESPRSLCSSVRKKKTSIKVIQWTLEMDSRLGADTDEAIAKELDIFSSQVHRRRRALGIQSFRSATTRAKTENTSAQRPFNSSSASVWSVWSAPQANNQSVS
jgi:hypothetical protein